MYSVLRIEGVVSATKERVTPRLTNKEREKKWIKSNKRSEKEIN
jgi:hypothetical protein